MFFVQIAGNLGKDPETRFTPSGQKVTTFNVACRARKGKEEITIWVRVTVWGDRFDKMISFLKKGSAVIVNGKMSPPTTYVDKNGTSQVSLEVVAEMIEFSPFGKPQTDAQTNQTAAQYSSHNTPASHDPFGYTDESAFEMKQPYGAAPSPYARTSGTAQGGSAQGDDDALPF